MFRTRCQAAPRGAALLALVALLAGVLLPAAATADEATGYPGYTDLRDLRAYPPGSEEWTVLHVDEQHTTDQGFWYAVGWDNSYMEDGWIPIPVRNMVWQFQPWGTWCDGPYKVVGWSARVGGYRCGPDVPKLTADYPDYPQRVAACRASSGNPDEDARPSVDSTGAVSWRCDDWVTDETRILDNNDTRTRPPQAFECAPWERGEDDGYGIPDCYHEFYSWLRDPRYPDGGYAGTNDQVTRTAAVEVTVSQTATASQTRTASITATHGRESATVSGMVNGRRRTVTASAPVLVPGKATATRSATTTASATRVGRASCTLLDAESALACATELAEAKARRSATDAALTIARTYVNKRSAELAKEAAAAAAKLQAQHAPVTSALRQDARARAQKLARARLEDLRHR